MCLDRLGSRNDERPARRSERPCAPTCVSSTGVQLLLLILFDTRNDSRYGSTVRGWLVGNQPPIAIRAFAAVAQPSA